VDRLSWGWLPVFDFPPFTEVLSIVEAADGKREYERKVLYETSSPSAVYPRHVALFLDKVSDAERERLVETLWERMPEASCVVTLLHHETDPRFDDLRAFFAFKLPAVLPEGWKNDWLPS
jgi:hypothetical protein